VAFSAGGDGGRRSPELPIRTRRLRQPAIAETIAHALRAPQGRGSRVAPWDFQDRSSAREGSSHGKEMRLKVVAIGQDDGGKRGGVAACYNFAGPGGHVLINVQIAFSCAANF
jgi:hypothetical protein